jgi:hypothetical protein
MERVFIEKSSRRTDPLARELSGMIRKDSLDRYERVARLNQLLPFAAHD